MTDREPTAEVSDHQALIDTAEDYLTTNPLVETVVRGDGSVERTLSTLQLYRGPLSDPIDLKSIARHGSVDYTLRDDMGVRFDWSTNPASPVGTVTFETTPVQQLPMNPLMYGAAFGTMNSLSKRFEKAQSSHRTTLLQRVAKHIGALGIGRRVT